MRGEAAARKGVEEARLAVIRACGELRESEMFLSAVMADERSAVGSAASAAGVANTHRSNLREQRLPCKVLRIDSAHEAYAESKLLEAASALQKTALILGSPHIRHWFDEGLLARAQGDMLQIQVQMLAKLRRMNTRALEDLHARQGTVKGMGLPAISRTSSSTCPSVIAGASKMRLLQPGLSVNGYATAKSPSVSLVIALTVTGAVPVLRNAKVSLLCHSTEKACSAGAGLSASAIFSMASRCRVAFASAFSAASRAFFEAFEYHQENTAPTMVKTAHTALMTADNSINSSSVRCELCVIRRGVLVGHPHLTEKGTVRGADGSPSSASSSAHSSGAEGSRGLPGASAHTPAGHTVQVSQVLNDKIFARPEVWVRRG